MNKKMYYLEYELLENRPGLFGEIASLFGMLDINIETINGVHQNRRGLLIVCDTIFQIPRLVSILKTMETLKVLKVREATLLDRLAVRHGRYILRDVDDPRVFHFVRDELGILVDFLAELFRVNTHKLIGIRGLSRVGKTESLVAASVSANRRWTFVSSTLLKQTIREQFSSGECGSENIFIIDGIVSTHRATEAHGRLIEEIMKLDAIKVIEHPDIFCENSKYQLKDFDYLIELRNYANEDISQKIIDSVLEFGNSKSIFNDFNN